MNSHAESWAYPYDQNTTPHYAAHHTTQHTAPHSAPTIHPPFPFPTSHVPLHPIAHKSSPSPLSPSSKSPSHNPPKNRKSPTALSCYTNPSDLKLAFPPQSNTSGVDSSHEALLGIARTLMQRLRRVKMEISLNALL